jgi:WD40 repeat protein
MDKFENLKFYCRSHRSEMGGVCDNFNCESTQPMMCVKCISDNTNCVRLQKHNMITFNEFLTQFFEVEYQNLKKDFNHSKELSNAENYCANAENIIFEFRNKIENINGTINEIYRNMMDKVNILFEDFNIAFVTLVNEKEKLLHESLEQLNDKLNYTMFSDYNLNNLKEKMSKMPAESFNNVIYSMKKTIRELKEKSYMKFEEQVSSFMVVSDDILKKYETAFQELQIDLDRKHNLLKNSLRNEIFLSKDDLKLPIEHFKPIYDMPVDFSVNSNFLEKKFTIFQHSNGTTLMAYPTSQNTIKLEFFDKFIMPKCENVSERVSKEMSGGIYNGSSHDININSLSLSGSQNMSSFYAKQQGLNHNARDEYLYFTLQYHGGKIIDLQYYRVTKGINSSDYLITSSEDKTIKIWDITNLNKYLKNVNEYYKSNCLRTLVGHDNRISCFMLLSNPFSSFSQQITHHYIISIGYGDRIKVWDLEKATFIRDFESVTNFDNIMLSHIDTEKNLTYIITANNNFSIRVWDFEKGTILSTIKYANSKVISIINMNDFYGGFFIVDETSKCAFLDNKFELTISNQETFQTNRIGAIKWDRKSVYIYAKNGMMYEFDVSQKKIISRVKISDKPISFAMKYHHHTQKDMLVVHSQDQRIRVLTFQ